MITHAISTRTTKAYLLWLFLNRRADESWPCVKKRFEESEERQRRIIGRRINKEFDYEYLRGNIWEVRSLYGPISHREMWYAVRKNKLDALAKRWPCVLLVNSTRS